MAFKDYVTFIPPIYLEAFLRGEEIKMQFYRAWRLQVGDTLKWLTEEQRGAVKVTGIIPRIKGRSWGYGTVYALKRVT